ncbi:hypothetical protein AAMO2058_000010600 [Amorphochlora amoebiformis]|eukprot:867691-Amorphochlora_amoeboformis.AAC.3
MAITRKLSIARCREMLPEGSRNVWIQGIVASQKSDYIHVDDGSGVVRVKASQLTKASFSTIGTGELVTLWGKYKKSKDEITTYSISRLNDPNAESMWLLELVDVKIHREYSKMPTSSPPNSPLL